MPDGRVKRSTLRPPHARVHSFALVRRHQMKVHGPDAGGCRGGTLSESWVGSMYSVFCAALLQHRSFQHEPQRSRSMHAEYPTAKATGGLPGKSCTCELSGRRLGVFHVPTVLHY